MALINSVALVTLLSACGQKGPLFLPPKPVALTPSAPLNQATPTPSSASQLPAASQNNKPGE
ncbi:MAG: lipoprotein [Undibacterium sp.]|uniref:LPS translocon maturation chaperone LptM n=1 Tax=Undibacterium sp. TaxID=1914977 RepID=UPI00271BDDC5|nr:lipoprotein [Undibacterium sp.]MDO8654507.1 lipoprotein [Undibacterium sp.]